MSDNRCERCGRAVGDLDGLCPACMLAEGLSEKTIEKPSSDPVRDALELKLGGQYRILRVLGSGGMGAVYLARDLTLEREVAIKVIQPASTSPGTYERFRREAKTAAKLSHPNIVPLHAFGEIDGMPYFVMGFVRGETLAERLRRDGKLPEDEARRVMAEVADALDHAHREGVVHRDVKPENVLLEDATGRAFLTDFGIAKSTTHGETLTQQGSLVGTPHFMSPEQAAGRADIDGRSDLYSLGVVAYAMVTGRLPFEGASTEDVLAKHLTQEPPPVRSLAPTVSETMQQSIERCLAKDRSKRWADARALRVSLGVSDDAELPDALEAVHGHGVAFTAIATMVLWLVWMIVIRLENAHWIIVGILVAVLLAGYVVVVAGLRSEGFPIHLVQRVIWSEPAWWPLWYPRGLRRPIQRLGPPAAVCSASPYGQLARHAFVRRFPDRTCFLLSGEVGGLSPHRDGGDPGGVRGRNRTEAKGHPLAQRPPPHHDVGAAIARQVLEPAGHDGGARPRRERVARRLAAGPLAVDPPRRGRALRTLASPRRTSRASRAAAARLDRPLRSGDCRSGPQRRSG